MKPTIIASLVALAIGLGIVIASFDAPSIAGAHGEHAPDDCEFRQGPTVAFHESFVAPDGHSHAHQRWAVRYGPADDSHWHYITTYRDTNGDTFGEPYNGSLNDYRDAYGQCDIDAEYFSEEVFVITAVADPAYTEFIGQSYLSPVGVERWWEAGRGEH